eukprot:12512800-Prorocentrum_lima.AAC.1
MDIFMRTANAPPKHNVRTIASMIGCGLEPARDSSAFLDAEGTSRVFTMNKHGADVDILWNPYAYHVTRFTISGFAVDASAVIDVELSDPLVLYPSLIIDVELEEFKD